MHFRFSRRSFMDWKGFVFVVVVWSFVSLLSLFACLMFREIGKEGRAGGGGGGGEGSERALESNDATCS